MEIPSTTAAAEYIESKMLSKMLDREQRLADLRADSEIIRFFARKNIFVTGGTGFMGKVLIHKLLETVADLGQIFVLIRSKGGKSPQTRLEKLLVEEPFKHLTSAKPYLMEKLVAVEGDVTSERLGMSDDDYLRMVGEVSVIYHVAATVKFEEDLTKSVQMNVKGTAAAMELAVSIGVPRLAAFIHISTAYTHCYSNKLILEMVYPSTRDPNKIVELCEKGDPELINSAEFTRKIIGTHPNTYTFTKEIAEGIVNAARHILPVAIVRPSIVIAAIDEPVPGWVDNLYGPTGMMIGANVGLLRTMYVRREKRADLLPVDMGINLLCAATWKTNKEFYAVTSPVRALQPVAEVGAEKLSPENGPSQKEVSGLRSRKGIVDVNSNDRIVGGDSLGDEDSGEEGLPQTSSCTVYNCVTGNSAPLTWGQVETMGNYMILKYPLEKMLWYPGGSFKSSHAVNELCSLFQHKMSSAVIDAGLRAVGKKPFVYKMMTKAEKAMSALSFFATQEWRWETNNLNSLAEELNEADKAIFNFDMRDFRDWPGYFEEYVKGCRQYLVKNDPASVDACREKLRWFYLLHIGFRFLCVGGLGLLLYFCWFH